MQVIKDIILDYKQLSFEPRKPLIKTETVSTTFKLQ